MNKEVLAQFAARDPHLNPPPFRGRKETTISSQNDEKLGVNRLRFSPPERGRDRVGVN